MSLATHMKNIHNINIFIHLLKILISVKYVPWYADEKVCGHSTEHFKYYRYEIMLKIQNKVNSGGQVD